MEALKSIEELDKMTFEEVYLYSLERKYLRDLELIEAGCLIDIGRSKFKLNNNNV